MTPSTDHADRAARYAQRYGPGIEGRIGYGGQDGTVYRTDQRIALKVFYHQSGYVRERNVYRRLQECGCRKIRNCSVPMLVRHDEELRCVEMTIVNVPYVLDFAGATLHEPIEFPEHVLDEWQAEKREEFGDRWPEVQAIMFAFQQMGIYLTTSVPETCQSQKHRFW